MKCGRLKLNKQYFRWSYRQFFGLSKPNILESTAQIEKKTNSIAENILLPLSERCRGPIDINITNKIPAPSILLLGNHSSGKSSFINYILEEEIQQTGVAPTDDGFTVINSGDFYLDRDGPSLVGDPSLGFTGLTRFGPRLVNLMKLKVRPDITIKNIIFVDSPGMIDSPTASVNFNSSSKYKSFLNSERGYDFESVIKWFAKRVDVILLFFDPDKPGTTGETLSVLTNSLEGYEYKMSIILNKSDKFERNVDFARAYGSLCWNLSKVIHRKDLPMIYTSFTPTTSLNKNNPSLSDLEAMRKELIDIVASAPVKRVDNLITELYTNTKLLSIHLDVMAATRAKYRSLRLNLAALFAIPITTAMVDITLWYNNLVSVLNIGLGSCFSSAAFGTIFYLQRAKINTFADSVINGDFLQKSFEELYDTADEFDEELYSLWQIAKPKLKSSIKLIGLPYIPRISASEYKDIDKILSRDIPDMRKSISHLAVTKAKEDEDNLKQ